jgi:phosphatidylserine decarboxylase
MRGGTRNVKLPSQGKIMQEENAYKKELQQIKNNISKLENKLIRSANRKRSNG